VLSGQSRRSSCPGNGAGSQDGGRSVKMASDDQFRVRVRVAVATSMVLRVASVTCTDT